jgi:plastocyanin
VPVGVPVTWINHDEVPHDVVAYDGTWQSPLLQQNETYTRTFTAPGRYTYFCSLHPFMQAAVVVQ